MTDRCPYCGQPKEGNAGDYYHYAACQAKACEMALSWLRHRLDIEREVFGDFADDVLGAEIRLWEERLESARYVGD